MANYTWTSTTSLPAGCGKRFPAVVAYNGYLYVIGGKTSSSTVSGNVFFAPIHSDGSLGSWTADQAFGSAYQVGAQAIIRNGYMYYMGGAVVGETSGGTTVMKAQINSNGTLNPFSSAGNLLQAVYYHVASYDALSDTCFVVGGRVGGSPILKVEQFNFDGSGNVTGAKYGTDLLYAPDIAGGCVQTLKGGTRLWSFSGTNGNTQNSSFAIYFSGGSLQTWASTANDGNTGAYWNGFALSRSGTVWSLDESNSATTNMRVGKIYDGNINWSGNLTTSGRTASAAGRIIAYGNYLYALGGTYSANVYYCRVEYPANTNSTTGGVGL